MFLNFIGLYVAFFRKSYTLPAGEKIKYCGVCQKWAA